MALLLFWISSPITTGEESSVSGAAQMHLWGFKRNGVWTDSVQEDRVVNTGKNDV
jgi:hypothetical protein